MATQSMLASWLTWAPLERAAVRGVYFRNRSVAETARRHAVAGPDIARALRTAHRRVALVMLDEQAFPTDVTSAAVTDALDTLAALPVATWRWDTANEAMTWSDALFELYGYPPGAVTATIGLHQSHKHHDDRATVEALIMAGATEVEPVVFAQRIIRADGTSCRVIMRVSRESIAREVLTGRVVVVPER